MRVRLHLAVVRLKEGAVKCLMQLAEQSAPLLPSPKTGWSVTAPGLKARDGQGLRLLWHVTALATSAVPNLELAQ